MDAQFNRKTARLATLSLIVGILSFGLAILSFIPIIRARQTGGPDAILFALGFLALFLMLGGLILGILGFIIGVIALIRFKKQRGQNKIMRMAALGLILNSLGIATPLIFLLIPLLLTPVR